MLSAETRRAAAIFYEAAISAPRGRKMRTRAKSRAACAVLLRPYQNKRNRGADCLFLERRSPGHFLQAISAACLLSMLASMQKAKPSSAHAKSQTGKMNRGRAGGGRRGGGWKMGIAKWQSRHAIGNHHNIMESHRLAVVRRKRKQRNGIIVAAGIIIVAATDKTTLGAACVASQ